MTHEAIRAEYDKARAPDGTIPWERMKELARRLYGYELAEGPPLPAALPSRVVDPDDPSSADRAEARRVEAAALLAQLVAVRDTLEDLDQGPLHRLVRLPKDEVDTTPEDERARRLGEYHDLQLALEATAATLQVAERLLRRIYGPGPLVAPGDMAALATLYQGADDPKVVTFLERRPATVALLRDAAPALCAYWGEGVTLHLAAANAPPFQDDALWVKVRGHGLGADLDADPHDHVYERAEKFYETWTAARGEAARRVSFNADAESPAHAAPIPTVVGVR